MGKMVEIPMNGMREYRLKKNKEDKMKNDYYCNCGAELTVLRQIYGIEWCEECIKKEMHKKRKEIR